MTPEAGDLSGLAKRCHGSGILICRCMGDGCCCGFYGEADCPGCEGCRWSDEDRDKFQTEDELS